MAPLSKTLAVAALFAALGSAAPVEKRETVVVYETVTDVVWTTVDVTSTVNAAGAAVTPAADDEEWQKKKPTTTTTEEWEAAWTPSIPAWTPSIPTFTPSEPAWTPEPEPEAWTSSFSTTWAAATTWAATTTWAAPTTIQTTTAAAATTASSSSGSYSGSCDEGSPCTGDLTYYVAGLGSCGITSDGTTQNVVALPVGMMQDSDCGKTVTITYEGKTSTGTVWDKCMGCDDVSIDLSEKLFGELGSMAAGRLKGAKWYIE